MLPIALSPILSNPLRLTSDFNIQSLLDLLVKLQSGLSQALPPETLRFRLQYLGEAADLADEGMGRIDIPVLIIAADQVGGWLDRLLQA